MKSSRFMLIASMVIFGTIGLFVRGIPLPSAEIALYRSLLAILFVGIAMIIGRSKEKSPQPLSLTSLILLFLSGAALGLNWIFLFEAYKYTTVSNATLAYYFAPVIVTLLCPILFKEKMSARQWICFAASTTGVALISGSVALSTSSTNTLGVIFGLIAACLYASVVLINKYIKDMSGINRTFFQFIAAATVLLPYVLCTGGLHLSSFGLQSGIYMLAVGIIHTGLAYCLYFSSIKRMRGQEVSILSYIDPLIAVIVSVTLMQEPISVPEIIGGILIIGSAIFNEIVSNTKKKDRDL